MKLYRIMIVIGLFGIVVGLDLLADGLTKDEKKVVNDSLKELKEIKLVTEIEQDRTAELLRTLEKLSDKEPKLKKIITIWSKLLGTAKGVISEKKEEKNKLGNREEE